MARRELLKEWWKGEGIFGPIAAGLNAPAQWCNRFDAVPPLVARNVATGYGVKLYFEPWESPFTHPFKVWPSATVSGELDCSGGLVYAGGAPNTVADLDGETASNGWKLYLKVKHYYNTATASEYALGSTTGAWPTCVWNSSNYAQYIRVAEISGTTLLQYIYEDQIVPRIPPPVPDTTNTYFLMSTAGTIQWVQAGACP